MLLALEGEVNDEMCTLLSSEVTVAPVVVGHWLGAHHDRECVQAVTRSDVDADSDGRTYFYGSDRGGDVHTHSHRRTTCDRDTGAHADTKPVVHADACVHLDPYGHADARPYGDARPDLDLHGHADVCSYGDACPDRCANASDRADGYVDTGGGVSHGRLEGRILC
jgi:hypothetical protein